MRIRAVIGESVRGRMKLLVLGGALASLAHCSTSRTPLALDGGNSDAGAEDAGNGDAADASPGAAGALDSAFGDRGVAVVPVSGGQANAVALQPDGRIVVAGFADRPDGGPDQHASMLARFEDDGSLDSSFGTGGRVLLPMSETNRLWAVAIQADGKILAAGTQTESSLAVTSMLMRFEPDGTIDGSFGEGGAALRGSSVLRALVVLPNSMVVAGGYEVARVRHASLLLRYLPDGSLDPTFGGGGRAEQAPLSPSDDHEIDAIAIASDRSILAAGTQSTPTTRDFLVQRYTPDGLLDGSFGRGGIALGYRFPSYAQATSLAIQRSGKVVVAGSSTTREGQNTFVIARYGTDGSIDRAFGSGGATMTAIADVYGFANSLGIDSDERILAAGYSNQLNPHWTLVRYMSEGALDLGFGNDGIVTTTPGIFDRIFGIALDQRSRAVVAGQIRLARQTFAACGRYLPGPRP